MGYAELSSPVRHQDRLNVSKLSLSQIHFLAVGSSAATVVLDHRLHAIPFSYTLLLLHLHPCHYPLMQSKRLRTITIPGSRQTLCALRVVFGCQTHPSSSVHRHRLVHFLPFETRSVWRPPCSVELGGAHEHKSSVPTFRLAPSPRISSHVCA